VTLPLSGPMSASMINVELGRAGNAPFDINGAQERALAAVPAGKISFSDFYGKSSSFSPLNISDCILWLDAADAATITMGAAPHVFSWEDKSVSSLLLYQSADTARPSLRTDLYTLPCIGFEPGDYASATGYLYSDSSITLGLQHTIVTVSYWNSTAANARQVLGLVLSSAASNVIHSGLARNLYLSCETGVNGGVSNILTAPSTVYARQATNEQLADTSNVNFYAVNGDVTTATLVQNGAARTLTKVGTSWTPAAAPVVIGQPDSQYAGGGAIAEIVVYDRILTLTETSDLFDYLTEKWKSIVPP